MIREENPPFGYWTKKVAQTLLDIMEPVLKKHQLTVDHWQVLNSMPLDDKTNINELLDLLENKGWIDKNNSYEEQTDTLKLTKKGEAAKTTIFNEIHETRKKLFTNISREDFEISLQVMKQIIENKKELHEENDMNE
ncbi:MarR family winged helix-turn-helix transcriptional regulator [Shimazuella alba]|uniref:MarR family transcriptional regulator n=1 Tax=Shimazuella alba TaxID=2690964 RepID=A0A6I4VX70_9BACL|nr:hypothetical protein [Shimazuella alba]MXQ55453.1 hypothetical protein [Shimazuella alba]